jgi:hypothetical protein
MKKNNYLFNALGVSLFILFFLWVYFAIKSDENSLSKNKIVTYGLIYDVDYFPRGSGLYIYYEFKVNDSLYKDREQIFIAKDNINLVKAIVIDKYLPIVYDKTNAENNEMLFSKKAYESFGLIRHDSLNNIYLRLDSIRDGYR